MATTHGGADRIVYTGSRNTRLCIRKRAILLPKTAAKSPVSGYKVSCFGNQCGHAFTAMFCIVHTRTHAVAYYGTAFSLEKLDIWVCLSVSSTIADDLVQPLRQTRHSDLDLSHRILMWTSIHFLRRTWALLSNGPAGPGPTAPDLQGTRATNVYYFYCGIIINQAVVHILIKGLNIESTIAMSFPHAYSANWKG